MLVREYDLRVNIDNEEYPFCICNAKSKMRNAADFLEVPTREEIEASALKIIPLKDKERFYSQLSSGYSSTSIGDEVMSAMRGQSENWKVIRCSITSTGLVFVVINPKICTSGIKVEVGDIIYGSYEADLKEGIVYIWLENGIVGCADFELKVKKYNKGKVKTFRKYRIVAWSHRFELTEYYKHLIRISDIERETKGDEDNKIHVKEFYD